MTGVQTCALPIYLDLPVNKSSVQQVPPSEVAISLDAQNKLYWHGVELSEAELEAKMRAVSQLNPQPIIKIRADKATRYAGFAKVLANTRRMNLDKVAITGSEQFRP